MRKIRLDLDQLEVDSFATHSERHAPGTVRGHDDLTFDCGYTPGSYDWDPTHVHICQNEDAQPTVPSDCHA